MDFASLMKSQISTSKSSSESAASEKKYVKRAELEAERQASYQAEQEALEARRREKLDKKRKLEEEETKAKRDREEKKRRLAEESRRLREEEEEQAERARRKRLGLPDLPSKGALEENGSDGGVDQQKIVEKLREMGEPIRLFGESDDQRRQRWRRLDGRASGTPPAVLTNGPIPTTLTLVPETQMKIPGKAPKDAEGKKFVYRQLASYFTMVLEEWEEAMANRADDVKGSSQGKAAFNSMIQARDNLKPLFRKMEKDDINDSVLEAVVEIVHAAQERRYVDANDGYLRLSIGKASVT
jgi:pre-mRNA-splicing factor 18